MTRTKHEQEDAILLFWRKDAEAWARREHIEEVNSGFAENAKLRRSSLKTCVYCGKWLGVSEANSWLAWVCKGDACKRRDEEFQGSNGAA